MNILADDVDHVIGVDPDRDRVTLAVVDAATTGVIARGVFPATVDGYGEALAFAHVHSSAIVNSLREMATVRGGGVAR